MPAGYFKLRFYLTDGTNVYAEGGPFSFASAKELVDTTKQDGYFFNQAALTFYPYSAVKSVVLEPTA